MRFDENMRFTETEDNAMCPQDVMIFINTYLPEDPPYSEGLIDRVSRVARRRPTIPEAGLTRPTSFHAMNITIEA